MKYLAAFGSGLAGAVALNLLHESLRRIVPNSPRMDLLGQQALSHLLRKVVGKTPSQNTLYPFALAGDVIGNALYYSLSGSKSPQQTWLKGTALGTAAGLGAVLLPKKLGLSSEPSTKTTETSLLTISLYLAGGLVAAGAYGMLRKKVS